LSQTTPSTLGGGFCPHSRCGPPVLLEVLLILRAPIVELLVIVGEITGHLEECDLGAAAIGPLICIAVALGPASASRDGLKRRFVASSVELLAIVVIEIVAHPGEGILGTAAVSPIVRAAVAPGPARAIVCIAVALGPASASRDGLKRRFVASGIKLLVVVILEIVARPGERILGTAAVGPIIRAAVAPGPARASRDGLPHRCVASGNAVGVELLVVDVVFVELLLLRGEIAKSIVLLGDGGSRCRLGFLGEAAFGRILRIALELDGLRPAVLGGRLRPVEAKEESLLAAKRLLG